MNIASLSAKLLAQSDRWREMGRDFRVDHSKLDATLLIASVIVLLCVLVFLWLLNRVMNRQEGPQLYNDPKQLFKSLCKAHELSSGQRRLLLAIARAQNLAQPASLFIEVDRFETAGELPSFRGHRAQLEKLRAKLFCDLNDPVVESAPEARRISEHRAHKS